MHPWHVQGKAFATIDMHGYQVNIRTKMIARTVFSLDTNISSTVRISINIVTINNQQHVLRMFFKRVDPFPDSPIVLPLSVSILTSRVIKKEGFKEVVFRISVRPVTDSFLLHRKLKLPMSNIQFPKRVSVLQASFANLACQNGGGGVLIQQKYIITIQCISTYE